MSTIDDVKRDLDALSLTTQQGEKHVAALIQHVEGIEERVERLAKNAVATSAVIRNAFRRVWALLKSCLDTAKQFVAVAENIGRLIEDAMGKDLISKVEGLVECLAQCFRSIPFFVRLVGNIKSVKSEVDKVFRAAHAFMGQCEDVAMGSWETLRRDAALIERDVQSALADCLFSLHAGASALMGCCNVAGNMESSAREAPLSAPGAPLPALTQECLRALEAFEGKTGTDEFERLKASLEDLAGRLEGMHDRFSQKLHDLEKKPEGFWEWVASPFVKVYEACDFGAEVLSDICTIPSLWGEAKSSASTGRDLLQTTHDRFEDFWHSLAAMVRQLCDDMWVTYNPQFEDFAIKNVHFDPALGFLGWFETHCLSFLNQQQCLDGPRRMVQQAVSAVVHQKDRVFKKTIVDRTAEVPW